MGLPQFWDFTTQLRALADRIKRLPSFARDLEAFAEERDSIEKDLLRVVDEMERAR
jgi:hypothetical protein